MFKLKSFALAALLVLVVAFPVVTTAQDEGAMVACDSTLITLLYIAEHDYGFVPMAVDAASLDKGIYAPLFEEMMAMMEEGEMEEETMIEEGEMMMDEEMMTLAPGDVPGEDESCTALRAELEAFFYAHFTMMMEEN
jgi:hypothetical protein